MLEKREIHIQQRRIGINNTATASASITSHSHPLEQPPSEYAKICTQIILLKLFVVSFAFLAIAAAAVAPSSEYLPPGEEPSSEYLPPSAETKLAEDGYRYKTIRKLKYRHRRDVSSEYLPPLSEPIVEYLPPVADTKVADDGYRYKTVRKLKYRARHRRDVSELPSNEYLPPVEDAVAVAAAPEVKSAELAKDGYRYKTVRKLKYRNRHRREAANEYLPPAAEAEEVEEAEPKSADLAEDGYRYKTVRRLKYRH
ncbi:uncharacterized protein LOC129919338 [Episyrphus balteatus]|uniref:uncharacterized protein LOC129919338 n=1 Tax=Episyrphus balteatus TaxID=286459 RepID=UPI0024856364|nr:uncharacterized protein LOC129919338 [Episyrphus balteatus]